MQITKYEHACVVIEEQGKRLVIDPGSLTRDMSFLRDVVAVVFTHSHFDHFSAEQLAAILAANPTAQVFGTSEVAAAAENVSVTIVQPETESSAGPFRLGWYGGRHAFVTSDKPQAENLGVLVNGALYHPGDSLALPGNLHPKVLALPLSGPWVKTGEAIAFLQAVRPEICFPTHDIFHSADGQEVAENWVVAACKETGTTFEPLRPGESLEV